MRKFLLTLFSFVMVLSLALFTVACKVRGGKADTSDSTPTVSSPEETTNSSEDTNTSAQQPEHVHTPSAEYFTDGEYHWHTCTECGEIIDKAQHQTGEATVSEQLKEGETCVYTVTYTANCSVCEKEVTLDETTYDRHDYTMTITTEANCSNAGVKTYTCTHGDSTYTEPYTNESAHVYGEGTTIDNVTTYKCQYCDNSYEVISAKQSTAATTTTETLAKVGAIELKTATIALDTAVLKNISENTNVSITAETKTADDVTVSDEVKTQIGDSPVYDFTLTADDTPVSQLGGKVTITVPYTLGENEDPDAIAVWYLNGDKVESIEASYANRYVTFETDHFSYYTVVKLSREETCKVYGHSFVTTSTKESTCAAQGYMTEVCRRCGETKTTTLPLTDHDYKLVSVTASTTTTHGHRDYKCENCGDTYVEELPLIRETGDGFLENLLISTLRNSLVMNASMNGQSNYAYLINENGMICLASVSDNNINIQIGDKSYSMYTHDGSYNYSIRESQSSGPDASMIFAMIEQIYPLIPEMLTDAVWNVVTTHLLTVEETEAGYTLTLDLDKFATSVRTILASTVKEDIDFLLGKGAYDGILDFAQTAFESTVGELLETLKVVYNVNVDGIIDFADGFIKGMSGGQASAKDMLVQMKDMTIPNVITMIMSGMGGGNSPAPTPTEPAYPMPEPKFASEEGQAPAMDFAQIKEMIEQYASMKVNDLVHLFPEVPETLTGSDLLAFIGAMSHAPAAITSLTAQIETDKKGALSTFSFEAVVGNDTYAATMTCVKELPAEDQKILDDAKANIENYVNNPAFTISEDNYEFIVKDLEETYGVKFSYTEEDGEVVLVSDRKQEKDTKWVKGYAVYEDGELLRFFADYEYEAFEAFQQANSDKFKDGTYYCDYDGRDIEVSYASYYEVRFMDYSYNGNSVTVNFGDPDHACKSFGREVTYYTDCEEEDLFRPENETEGSVYAILNVKTGEVTIAYHELTTKGIPTVEEITEEEYLANTPNGWKSDRDETFAKFGATYESEYYKLSYDNGDVQYRVINYATLNGVLMSYGNNIYYTTIVSPVNNPYYATYVDFEMKKDGLGEYVRVRINMNTLGEYGYMEYRSEDVRDLFYNYAYDTTRNSATLGNATMKIATYDDKGNYVTGTYTVTVGGKNYGPFNYHLCKKHNYATLTAEDRENCTTITLEYCTICGEGHTNTKTSHKWVSNGEGYETIPHTQTQYGVYVTSAYCSVCGATRNTYYYTACEHVHTHEDGDNTVCDDCRYSYVTENGAPVLYLENLGYDESGNVIFGFRFAAKMNLGEWPEYTTIEKTKDGYSRYYSERYDASTAEKLGVPFIALSDIDNQYNYLVNEYSVYADVCYYDENGKLQHTGYRSYGRPEREYVDFDKDKLPIQYYRNIIRFNNADMQEKLNAAEKDLEKNCFIVITVVNDNNGEAFEYVLD